MMVAATWSPEQWTLVITSVVGSLSSAIVAVVTAIRTKAVHNELKPPSNGITNGALMEGIAQVQHLLVDHQIQQSGGKSSIPSATDVARDLTKNPPQNPPQNSPATS